MQNGLRLNFLIPTASDFSYGQISPTHIQVEVTWKCNWRCVHCYQDDHTAQPLSLDALKSLFSQVKAAGGMHAIITGGEPLVRKDIFELLGHIRRLGFGITLYTNGDLVSDDAADKLSELIAAAEISILSGDPAVHDSLSSSRGSYRRAMAAAEKLIRRDVGVTIKTPALRPAIATLELLRDKVREIGAIWQVDPEISRSYSGQAYPLEFKLGTEELQSFFRAFSEFNPQVGIQSRDPGVVDGVCLAGRRFCFVDAFGNVYPCLNFKSACDLLLAEGKRPEALLGNILESPFQTIWERTSFLSKIRDASSERFRTCSACEASQGCRQCMALNYEAHGDLFKPAPIVCNLTEAAAVLFKPGFVPASKNES